MGESRRDVSALDALPAAVGGDADAVDEGSRRRRSHLHEVDEGAILAVAPTERRRTPRRVTIWISAAAHRCRTPLPSTMDLVKIGCGIISTASPCVAWESGSCGGSGLYASLTKISSTDWIEGQRYFITILPFPTTYVLAAQTLSCKSPRISLHFFLPKYTNQMQDAQCSMGHQILI